MEPTVAPIPVDPADVETKLYLINSFHTLTSDTSPESLPFPQNILRYSSFPSQHSHSTHFFTFGSPPLLKIELSMALSQSCNICVFAFETITSSLLLGIISASYAATASDRDFEFMTKLLSSARSVAMSAIT